MDTNTGEQPKGKHAKTKGIGSVYQRGATWWISYSVNGKRERETSHSTNRADAVRLLKDRLGRIGSGRAVGPQVFNTTLADLREILLTDYRALHPRSVKYAERAWRRVGTYFHDATKAANIGRDTLTAYVAHSQARGMKPATISYDLAVVRRAFNLAVEAGRVASTPSFPRLSYDNRRTGFVEPGDLFAIVRHLPQEVQPIVTVAFWTGWRPRSELLTRRIADLDLRAGVLRLNPEHSKNHEGRTFPVGDFPALAQVLEGVVAATREFERATGRIIPWLFHREGERVRDFRGAWAKACKAAGRPGLYIHDMRRSAVRNLVRAGVPEAVAMEITGHKTRSVFERYNITSEADVREAGRKLAAFHASICHNLAQSTAERRKNAEN